MIMMFHMQSGIGCNTDGVSIDILASAGDIVFTCTIMKCNVILESHAAKVDMSCNKNKTVYMAFHAAASQVL